MDSRLQSGMTQSEWFYFVPRLTLTISAMILIAISSGVSAPISMPMGVWTLSIFSFDTPPSATRFFYLDSFFHAAYHTDILCFRPDGEGEALFVSEMAGGINNDIIVFADLLAGEGIRVFLRNQLISVQGNAPRYCIQDAGR